MLRHQPVAALTRAFGEVNALLAGDKLPVRLIKQLELRMCCLEIARQGGLAKAVGSTECNSHGFTRLAKPNTTAISR